MNRSHRHLETARVKQERGISLAAPREEGSWSWCLLVQLDGVLVFWFAKVAEVTELLGFEMKSARTHLGNDEAGLREHDIFEDPARYGGRGPRPLRATDLRSIHLTSLAQDLISGFRDMDAYVDALVEAGILAANRFADVRDQMGNPDEESQRVRRWSAKDFHLVADLYREARERGYRATNVWVAERLTDARGETVTRKQAERLIYRARHEFGTLGKDE